MNYFDAIWLVLQPFTLAVIIASALFGLFVGSMPGLTATMAAALLVPITFYMDPVPAIGAIVTCSAMAIFAGDIPGALLRIPGTPASAAYVDEAYKLGQKGRLAQVLSVNLLASAFGGIFGALVLIFLAPQLARVALNFSSYEYFWLALIGLSAAALISTASPLKGLISLFLGLFLATVGLDVVTGFPRYTLGTVDLMGGVSLIAALIGLFAVAELFRKATTIHQDLPQPEQVSGAILPQGLKALRRYKTNALRGSTMGTFLGILPGAGADIAGWISYAVSKRFSRTPEKFGKGHIEGIVDASASNNSSLGGAYVPALVFGIPGDSITAIVIGVLLIKGMNPGPTVFTQSGDIVAAIFIVFILANILLIPLGLLAIRAAGRVLSINQRVLLPIILMFSIVGAFAVNNSVFDLWIVLALGALGWVMEDNGFPVAPMVLGLVLGKIVEESFVNSMIKSGGALTSFVDRPIAGGLGVVFFSMWILPISFRTLRQWRNRNVGPDR
ncbi:tripartite tricarboxylate transporter permease [Thalassorhabdomicrobium marinisediminis]|uniref:tripartite tricarboxylate transporter permease n=1 Tax=Thalassorhabdomicrobium marinisediminis TaxID=2170577 RepID=UPI00248F7B7A|nr:tripartite tricarboxylate transporter permease [Thalassorhabdomicrobium marinisediminis]